MPGTTAPVEFSPRHQLRKMLFFCHDPEHAKLRVRQYASPLPLRNHPYFRRMT
ncbi:hypothetical protein ARZXY2_4785 (plasmid) [Arthrobacter sp. ZXY-2]|nr:hypothetical protein ARZXY2_4785 [Arthrobacter sp. ZXY-2]